MKKHAGSTTKQKTKGAPHPQWDSVFKANLTNVPGYAYAVAHYGRLVAEGAAGSARTSLNAPATPWTTSTRINLASVSKCVTVREALRKCEAEDLIVSVGNALTVKVFSERELFEIYYTREAIEGMPARLAAENSGLLDLTKLSPFCTILNPRMRHQM